MDLSRGAIPRIFSGLTPSPAFQPILHVHDIRPLGAERFTVQLTDGEYTTKAICGLGEPHQMIVSKRVDIHTMLKLTGWMMAPVQSKKEGKPQEVLAIGSVEPLGVVPEDQRVNPNVLRKYPDPKGGSMLSQIQGPPGELPQPASANNSAYTTPEKRTAVGMDQRGTPPAVSAPSRLNVHAVAGSSALAGTSCAPAWGAPTDSLSEAPTQDPVWSSAH